MKDILKNIRSALYRTTSKIISCTKFTDDNAAALTESTQTSANGFRYILHRYSQSPLSRLHSSCLTEPSTVTPVKSSSYIHALCSWSQTPYRQYQQYSQIFTAPSITVALILPHSAIYRHGVKHLQGSTSNIKRYSQRPLLRLHKSCLTAPSTVNPVKSLYNSHSLHQGSTSNTDRYSHRHLSRLH